MDGRPETAKNFWLCANKYPEYPFKEEKLRHMLNFIMRRNYWLETICDVGCGDGHLARILYEIYRPRHMHLCDLNTKWVNQLQDHFIDKSVTVDRVDLLSWVQYSLPTADLTLFMGVLPYIFDDDKAVGVLKQLHGKRIYVQTACSVRKEDISVHGFHEEMNKRYAALYRTTEHVEALLTAADMRMAGAYRAYPDKIDSSSDTKQIWFYCERE